MQETKEKLSLNVSSVNGIVTQKPVLPRGLISPYHQQAHDINHMLQSQMTRELYSQLRNLEERAMFCMQIKDKALEEAMRKAGEMEFRLRKALEEAEFWKKLADQKTELSKELATRLLKVKKREISMKTAIAEKQFAEEAESSTGENGDDVVDTARTRRCKRRRVCNV